MSAKKRAEASLSCAGTMVWFKVIVIGTSVKWRRDYERQIRTTSRKRGTGGFPVPCQSHRPSSRPKKKPPAANEFERASRTDYTLSFFFPLRSTSSTKSTSANGSSCECETVKNCSRAARLRLHHNGAWG